MIHHPEQTERRATERTCQMFHHDGSRDSYTLARMQLDFSNDAGLILWLETADVGERFGEWERVA